MALYQSISRDMIHRTKWHISLAINTSRRKLTPIQILNGIYNIKGKSMQYVMVANNTIKHITFNKGQCIGYMEPPIDGMSQTSVNSVLTQKMMDDQVQLDTFTPPLHHLFSKVKQSLDKLLNSFKSQLAKDNNITGMMNLARMPILTLSHRNLTLLPWNITTGSRMKSQAFKMWK